MKITLGRKYKNISRERWLDEGSCFAKLGQYLQLKFFVWVLISSGNLRLCFMAPPYTFSTWLLFPFLSLWWPHFIILKSDDFVLKFWGLIPLRFQIHNRWSQLIFGLRQALRRFCFWWCMGRTGVLEPLQRKYNLNLSPDKHHFVHKHGFSLSLTIDMSLFYWSVPSQTPQPPPWSLDCNHSAPQHCLGQIQVWPVEINN